MPPKSRKKRQTAPKAPKKGVQKPRDLSREIGIIKHNEPSSYPSVGLTPEKLALIFREADRGDVSRQSELFEEVIEKDPHIAAVLQSRRLALSSVEWEILPGDESAQAGRARDFCEDAIESLGSSSEYEPGGFGLTVRDLMDGVSKGFSACEIVWDTSGGQWSPKRIDFIHQKHFTFRDHNGDLLRVPRILTVEEPINGIDLPRAKYLLHMPRIRSGPANRDGVLRPCAWYYLFKNYSLKAWVIFAERYAMPMRMGKYGAGATKEERDVLRSALMYLSSDAAAMIPEGMSIEFLAAEGRSVSSGIYKEFIELLDAGFSKAILGQTLTTEQKGGTYATAKVHQLVRGDILSADADSVGPVINTQLFAPLAAFNFGPDVAPPYIKFQTEEPEALESVSNRLKTAQEIGVRVPENYAYEVLGIRRPKGDEPILAAPATAQPVLPVAAKSGGCSCGGHGNGSRFSMMAMSGGSSSDEWVDEYLERLAPSFKKSQDASIKRLSDYVRSLDAPPAPEEFEREAFQILGEEYSKIDHDAVSRTVQEAYSWYRSSGSLQPAAEFAFGGADRRAVDFLAKNDNFYFSRLIKDADTQASITDFLRERYLEGGEGLFGRGNPSTIQEFRDLMAQHLQKVTAARANLIIETAVQRIRNWGQISSMHEAGIVEVEIFEPTRDCDFCAEMHGKVMRVESAYSRMRYLSDLSPEEYEAELKTKTPTLENIDAYLSAYELPPYHPHCRGRIIKRVL